MKKWSCTDGGGTKALYRLWSLGVALSVLIVAIPGLADEGKKHGKGTHMKVSGVVSKVADNSMIIKTPWGRMNIAAASAPKNLKVGEEIDMWVNENNAVIDVHRKNEPAHGHRFLAGHLIYASPDRKEIKLWTPEGGKTVDIQAGRSKLSAIQEGTPVTVELNEAGKMIDIHRFSIELNFDEQPRTKPGNHITVHGVVDKIQSGVIFVKTPAARYSLSAKSAHADLKVGDEVTLWINEENMVVDHHRKGHEGVHRLISGKLVYVGKTKNQIKLWTPEGEAVFTLGRMEVKTKPIEEGSLVTVELDEKGTVMDLWKVAPPKAAS